MLFDLNYFSVDRKYLLLVNEMHMSYKPKHLGMQPPSWRITSRLRLIPTLNYNRTKFLHDPRKQHSETKHCSGGGNARSVELPFSLKKKDSVPNVLAEIVAYQLSALYLEF